MIAARGSERGSWEPPAPDPQVVIATVLVLGALASSWIWWALADGAYLGGLPYPETTLYEGMLLFCATFGVLLWAAPWRASLGLSVAARLAVGSLLALALWTGASALWSPAPDIAIADAQRTLGYALAFGLGLWSVALLGRRMELALLPVAFAAVAVGVVTMLSLLLGEDPARYLEEDGTLDYPLGYRNATAAFFLIAVWPAIALASSRSVPGAIRLVAAVAATVAIEIGVLCQSRGAIVGSAVALIAFLIASPHRGRAFCWLVLAAAPAAICIPAATDLYGAADSSELAGLADEMNSAGRAGLIGAAIALALATLTLIAERRFGLNEPRWLTPQRKRTGLAAGLLAVVVAILVLIGNPVTWLGDRFDEFQKGEPNLSTQSSRFSLNAGSNRSDVWRVAVNAFEDDPIFGDGAGGFQYRYTREREEVTQYAQDAHSIGLEMLSELGIVGFGLLATAIAAAGAGALRSRRLGPAAAGLSAGAIGAAAYWLTHSSLDWFWPYPAVSAPVFALMGAAIAPTLLLIEPTGRGRSHRLPLVAATAILALSLIPPLLSARFTHSAYSGFEQDPERAFADIDRARSLNHLSDAPVIAEGAVARELGQPERAIEAFREAARDRPEEWASHYFLSLLYLPDRPELARRELAVISELNPLGGPEVEALEKRIRDATSRASQGRPRGSR